jgi:site-specific recombinase XerD
VFRSNRGGALDPHPVRRIVLKAAKRAGIEAPVSPHWFRHAHFLEVLGFLGRCSRFHAVKTVSI